MPSEVPSGPWEMIASDLVSVLGKMYLVTIDYYSEYIDVELVHSTSSGNIIEVLAKLFAVHGIPRKLLTDGGPQFSSHQFRTFAKDWNFQHVMTSPTHHQANGMVERANQTVRRMIEKMKGDPLKIQAGLLNLRNTPKSAEAGSPAQRLMSRRTATKLPYNPQLLKPGVVSQTDVQAEIRKNRQTAGKYYNRQAKPLRKLTPGMEVRVRDGKSWKPARLLPEEQQTSLPRSYNLETERGGIWRRNRRDILKTKERRVPWREQDPVKVPNVREQAGPRPGPRSISSPSSSSPQAPTGPAVSMPSAAAPRTNPDEPTLGRPKRTKKTPAWIKGFVTN